MAPGKSRWRGIFSHTAGRITCQPFRLVSKTTPVPSPPKASTLLTIPQEIRDSILEMVILSPRSPPQHASTLEPYGRSVPGPGQLTNYWKTRWRIGYEYPDQKIHLFSMLFVNKQLRAETLSAIQRLPKNYLVDLMLVDEMQLWPTWLSIPCLTTAVDKVQANIRMIGFSRKTRKRCLFAHGNGGPSPLTLPFFYVLDRFLQLGPVGPQLYPDSREISIKTLDLNFVSAANPDDMFPEVFSRDGMSVSFPRYEHRPTKPDGSGYLMRPETLYLWLDYYIDQSLRMDWDGVRYGKLLYQRIGRIRCLVDGKLQSEIDIAARFEELTMMRTAWKIYPSERREAVWNAWRRKTYQTRVRLGLPVIYNESLQEIRSSAEDLEDIIQPVPFIPAFKVKPLKRIKVILSQLFIGNRFIE